MRGGPCMGTEACVTGRAAVDVLWNGRLNGKAVRSHSGERTACICGSGAVAPELITFGNADLFRLAALLHFFETVEDGRVHSCFKKRSRLAKRNNCAFPGALYSVLPFKNGWMLSRYSELLIVAVA
ncbi:hypothetical protein KL86DES1_21850 [uncultured Desulfovibrio sp.]|uniref:Uncharacterized protein n=1 Tax=uncultured Desulfovibrio sp. TaxID=167968 RepID=A0A212L9P5_9BACT|nr:hypothetical protein KL86DES1_21850 [uncultured Desulfovibrio sp.]VZH34746.1 conserved protein of unknown function [Desulfovibrio sp. 86]